MAARAMWKATVRIGTPARPVPVKMYSAVQDRRVHFHILHADDLVRVQQRLAHPGTGETVEVADARRGFEVERGRFVVLEDDELAAIDPEPSRDIHVTRFLAAEAIDTRWYDRPYYLGPDESEDRCQALALALAGTGRVGIARWTMRNRAYVGALRGRDGILELVSLHRAEDVVEVAALDAPEGKPIAPKEVELARTLIDALTGTFEPREFVDDYRQRVLDLIAAKQRGEKPRKRKFAKSRTATDESLEGVLRASLNRAG